MTLRLTCALAATATVVAAAGVVTASAGAVERSGGIGANGAGHWQARRDAGAGLRSSHGHGGSLSGFGGGTTSGWYQRGFGGLRDPGWGYRFGPGPGLSGR